jgi:ABC-2 type transport system permease protein
MLARLKQMLIKEFIQVFRDKRTRFVLFLPPIIQMLVFGYAATFEIRNVATAVLDLDHSQESRELVSRFSSSPYFLVQRQLTDRGQIVDLIDRGAVVVALQINPGFAENLRKGQTSSVQAVVDATNSNTALIAAGYVSQISQNFARDYQRDRMQRMSPMLVDLVPQVELQQRPWYNTDLKSRWFFVPGVIGSLTLVLVTTLTAFAVVREREIGTLEQIMVTPIRTMPQWLQWLTYLNPLRYFLVILRGVYLKGVGFSVLRPQMTAMAVLGVALLTISVFRFHKGLD